MENGKHFDLRIWHVRPDKTCHSDVTRACAEYISKNIKVEHYSELILNLFEIIQVSIIQETEKHLTG